MQFSFILSYESLITCKVHFITLTRTLQSLSLNLHRRFCKPPSPRPAHWMKSRISLCVLHIFLPYHASILQRIEPNFLQSVGNVDLSFRFHTIRKYYFSPRAPMHHGASARQLKKQFFFLNFFIKIMSAHNK